MRVLPEPLAPMGAYRQFILYKLVPRTDKKTDKIPIDFRTLDHYPKGSDWQKDPNAQTTFKHAAMLAEMAGPDHGVGFLFTENDPFFFVDLDDCLIKGQWSTIARDIFTRLNGAAVEVSQSGEGLHIFGTYSGTLPDHSCDAGNHSRGLYTSGRFVALTGDRAMGSAGTDHTPSLAHSVIPTYYPPKIFHSGTDWRDTPVPEWNGQTDDDDLIRQALKSKSVAAQMSDGPVRSFKAVWVADEATLTELYPSDRESYNASDADMALAQYLAFWTGKNHERILSLMWKSGLVREKWNREDYLIRTITRAVSLQKDVYGSSKLKGSDAQRDAAEKIRAEKLNAVDRAGADLLLPMKDARWWLDNKDVPAEELVKRLTPVSEACQPMNTEPVFVSGYQYLGAEQQAEFFKGCVYVQENHRIFTPSGALLKTEQFNATFGGYVFQLNDTTGKTTRKAFEAFTESQLVRFPKVEATCFKPMLSPGTIVTDSGVSRVNTYVPVETPRVHGDAGRFLWLLSRILPDDRDRTIFLSYMAACVQYPGKKFYWAPLIQGTFGNGKSFLTTCVVEAIGRKYCHMPKAKDIDEKFNSWLFGTIFVGVEDIYISEKRQDILETLKPMITGEWNENRAMQLEGKMRDVCCNFIFNTNHKDALREAYKDRRYCIFYSAQQSEIDVIRDGMGGDYFPDLYEWARSGGFAIVTDYLHRYKIPEKFNPAGLCHRAPKTSSYGEAMSYGLGSIEQEVLEAIEEGRPGFRGGWVSSMALDTLLKLKRKDSAIPINKRRDMLRALGYDWHPALRNGRVNNAVMPDNGKPRLFIQTGHGALLIQNGAEVAKVYEEAQRVI